MNIKKVRSNKREGFTLIEMVMVVVIIGVLSSMAMMKYGDVQTNAKIKADCATASTIATATTMAISDGKLSSTATSSEVVGILVTQGYLQSSVKSSKTNSDFEVEIEANNSITVTSGNETFYPKYKENSSTR